MSVISVVVFILLLYPLLQQGLHGNPMLRTHMARRSGHHLSFVIII